MASETPLKLAADGIAEIDAAAVNSAAARKLYKARVQIYPKLVSGKFRTIKWAFMAFALGLYYLLPWVRWPRSVNEPDQAVLVDFEGRRFYFFFIEIWPQEVYYITGLLILGALALFLVTSIWGRVWCGYACPQTVWTDLFIAVERFFEGDRNARMKLDKAPWTLSKAAKKGAKHLVWLLIAFATGGAWILYFHDAPTLFRDFFVGQAAGSAYLFAGVLTFTTYTLAGTMREQVCTFMCPWPRIQGAMTDAETFEVTYRRDRGEVRGPHRKGESWEGRGDCIDCKACVAACPAGIDIRDGDQLECINCALCIDACDDIMTKVGRPKGLIAYDTALNIERRLAGEPAKFKPIRGRTVVYALALAIVGAIMLYGLLTRATMDLNVLRDRAPPYVVLADGSVRNGFTVKILNKDNVARDFVLETDLPAGAALTVLGLPEAGPEPVLRVEADTVGSFRVFVTLPKAARVASSQPFTFTARAIEGGEARSNATVFQTGASP